MEVKLFNVSLTSKIMPGILRFNLLRLRSIDPVVETDTIEWTEVLLILFCHLTFSVHTSYPYPWEALQAVALPESKYIFGSLR